MALIVEKGGAFKIKLGDNIFGCATKVAFGGKVARQSAACTGTGDSDASVPGRKSYTLSASSLIRVATGLDIDDNVTTASIEELFEAGTIMPWTYGTDTPGATKKSGMAYIESFDEAAPFDGDPTFDVTFAVTGDVVYTVNPATPTT